MLIMIMYSINHNDLPVDKLRLTNDGLQRTGRLMMVNDAYKQTVC